MKLLDLSRPLAVLQELGSKFPLLPAGNIDISTRYPQMVRLSFHDDLGDFEAWRVALDIDPVTVRYHLQSGDTTLVLHGTTVRDDVSVELIAYGPNMALALQAVAA